MKIKKFKMKNSGEGYAILELLFYIAFLAVFSIVVINAIVTMARSFRETAIQAELMQSANIMERMSREIRQAYDISTISTNDLKLNTTDSSGVNKTIEFKFISPNVELWDNNVNIGNLNTPSIVTNVSFTQIITTKGKAVKIILTVRSTNDALSRTFDFYDTVVLRDNY